MSGLKLTITRTYCMNWLEVFCYYGRHKMILNTRNSITDEKIDLTP